MITRDSETLFHSSPYLGDHCHARQGHRTLGVSFGLSKQDLESSQDSMSSSKISLHPSALALLPSQASVLPADAQVPLPQLELSSVANGTATSPASPHTDNVASHSVPLS